MKANIIKVLLGSTCFATTCLVSAGAHAGQAVRDPATSTSADIASTSQTQPENSKEVVVTGSRIRRPNVVSAAPITSVTANEIKAQAAVSVEEVLNRLPQVAPDAQQTYADSDGRQRLKLRNLGFERTLTLVDGYRLGTQNAADTGIIPTSLLERVDILSGGASSVYGSDAISGVINFILRKDFDGVRIDANYNFYNHLNKRTIVSPVAEQAGFPVGTGLTNDGARSDITLTVGRRFFDDRLSVSGFVNHRQAELVPYDARSTSACYLLQTTRDGPLSCQISTYSAAGFISPRSGASNGLAFLNNPDGSRNFVGYRAGPGLAANPFDGYSYQRAFNRLNAGGFVNAKFADEFEVYGSAILYRDKSKNRFPTRVLTAGVYGEPAYQVNCDNPFLSTSQARTICGAAAGTSTRAPIEVRYRFNALPYSEDDYLNKGIRATGGVRGDLGDVWHYDVGGVFARNRQTSNPSTLPDFTRVNRSLNVVNRNGTPTCQSVIDGIDPACVPFDAFSAYNNNLALADYLIVRDSGESGSEGTLKNVVATVQGDLGKYGIKSPVAEQGIAIAVGAEYRSDTFRGFANQAYRSLNGGEDRTFRQNVKEANVEVQIPLVEKQSWTDTLQVNGGYRLSKYNSNEKTFSTWKVEGIWAPISDIGFRASINKAQRAPTVIEIAQATGNSYGTIGIQDPCASTRDVNGVKVAPTATLAQCRSTGLPDNLYGSETLACTDGACTTRNGGFSVTPETAYTKTFGVILKPRFLPGLVLSVDRYLIDLQDSIGYNDASYYLNGCLATGQSFFCSGIVRDPSTFILFNPAAGNPTAGYLRQGTTNFYKGTSHGWDIQAQYDLSLGKAGKLNLLFNGSRPTITGGQDAPQYVDASGKTQFRPRNCVGYYGPGCGVSFPKWQHGLRGTFTTSDDVFNVSLNWRYIGPQTVTYNSNDPALGYTEADARKTFTRVKPFNYFDLSLSFQIEKNYTLRLSANNLLDTTPPLFPNSYDQTLSRYNTNGARYDALGRQLSIGIIANL